MNKERIGISIAIDTGDNHFERLNTLINLGFRHIELYNKIIRVRSADIEDLKNIIKTHNINFSFHSMIQDLFSEDEDLAKQEYYTIKGELKLAHLIGCKRVVFHIHKKRELTEDEICQLKEIVNFSDSLNVEIALKNNSKGAIGNSYVITLLNKIPKLKICLDIGHLNIAINRLEIEDLDSFLEGISDRVVQLHLSGNDGKSDQHKEIDENSKEYSKKVIDYFKNKENIDFIIETKNIEQAMKILKFLGEEFDVLKKALEKLK